MSVELHLPDLPEVPISLGPPRPAPGRVPLSWHQRLREALGAYLPLLLMALLALASWWLLKNAPRPGSQAPTPLVSSAPDYTMDQFVLERFDPRGRLKLRIQGQRLQHFPVTDRIDVDQAEIRAIGADGRVTTAVARRALANGDGSEVQLRGGAEVRSIDGAGQAVVIRGEFLDLYTVTEQVKSPLPAVVQYGGDTVHAAGLEYDNPARRLVLQGPLRAELAPKPRP
ncbi:MAG: LPS export ABC transporter periplasmic protein LptC [Burkholderiales bacterium]|nr:LPS export ABC transporter periplasmic protein LptC [Burkholderiales bacterium]MDE2277905.1 LPS export ABC transporter periplasmic protein LptC [Burkholderiales bacterium]